MTPQSRRRVLVTGSRTWPQPELIGAVLETQLTQFGPLVVIQGDAPAGADMRTRLWVAGHADQDVEGESFPAQWQEIGRAAGIFRNMKMVDESKPDIVLAFIHNRSNGSTHCAKYAESRGIELVRYTIDDPDTSVHIQLVPGSEFRPTKGER